MAQDNKPLRKDLLIAKVSEQVSLVDIKEIAMHEGQLAPKHLHPFPVVGYIVSGQVRFQIEGEEAIILKEGEAFYEPKNKTILHFDNALPDKPLRFVAFYLKECDGESIKLMKE